jgi:hypothetical protein
MLTPVGALVPDASVPLCPMLAHTVFSFDPADVSAQSMCPIFAELIGALMSDASVP